MALPGRHGRGVTLMMSNAGKVLLGHAGNATAGATWPRCDVDVESCWRQCCRVMRVMALQLKVVLAVVRLCSLRDRSIEVLSHREQVGYSCWLVAE
jgi:hypothetical protein